MLKPYLEDYYLLKISMKEICRREKISDRKFYSELEKLGLLSTRLHYGRIDLGNAELNFKLKDKYASIVRRCNNSETYQYTHLYEGLQYMPIHEWVDFCIANKATILNLWGNYVKNGKRFKDLPSIDRLNDSKGYVLGNVHFTTQGYNSWKRNVRPIRVRRNGEGWRYFMSCEEAARHYGVRRQSIGDILRGVNRRLAQDFEVESSNVGTVLRENGVDRLVEYYNDVFER